MAQSPTGTTTATDAWHHFSPLPLSRLLEAALQAFVAHGYHGASVREIAEIAGVTVPTLYYHHDSKQGLLLALLNASMDDLVARTAAAHAAAGAGAFERFVDLVDCHVRYTCHRPRVAWLDAEARWLDDDAREAYAVPRRAVEQRMLDTIVQGVDEGVFAVEHPNEATRALFGAIGAVATWYRPDGSLGPDEVAARYVGVALDVVRADHDLREAGVRRARSR